ncbi:MAG: hypothetical protein IT426_10180 [Pirellulales bacterium]|nr:hypothetical protein [Pirellulales bacterium]
MPRYPQSTISGYNGVMDSNPPTEPKTPPPPDEAWRRFTLLDLLILFSGHEAALGLMKWYGLLDLANASKEIVQHVLALLCIFLLLGGGIAIPFIFLVQFHSRHRNVKISGGEIHAIVAIFYWFIFLVMSRENTNPEVFLLFVLGSIPCFFVFMNGGCLLIVNVISRIKIESCYWLNVYGYFLSLVSASSIILLLYLAS